MNRKEIIKEAQEQVNCCTPLYPESFIQGYIAGAEPRENKIADIKANCDLAIEGRDVKIKELEQQIEKMKCCENCKFKDCDKSSHYQTCWYCKNKDKWQLRR